MTSMMRSSALSLALGYVALGIAALVLFAAPLWYAWQVTIQDGRSEILQADAQRLADVYRREGADGLKTFIDARVQHADRGRPHPAADRRGAAAAGRQSARLAAQSAGDARQLPIDGRHRPISASRRRSCTSRRSASYNLLVGRDNKLFAPLETRFWYGLTAAIAVLSIAGLLVGLITRRALMSRVHSIRQTVSAIIHGDLKHRLPTHLSDDELNTLVAHHQRHARSDRTAGARRAQRLQLHRP